MSFSSLNVFILFSFYSGRLRVDSPLYFVYRSPEQKRKILTLPKDESNVTTDPIEAVDNAPEAPQPSSDEDKTSILSEGLKSSNVPKEAVPREIIQARSAFDAIKNYCNNLIRSSIKMTNPSPKNDNRKSINLNFFAKPIVDRPISIP